MMINKQEFAAIRKKREQVDTKFDELQGKSRAIVRLSKEIIYGLHRGEKVESKLKDIKNKIDALQKQGGLYPGLVYAGAYKVAMQEYVEAIAYAYFLEHKSLITLKELNIADEHYLLGLCDLVGELNRKAVNSAIEGNTDFVCYIKDFVAELYNQFLQFDFRNSELRRKFDGIKYELKKLEDLVLQLRLKEK